MPTSYDYYPAVLNAIDIISQGNTRTNACDDAGITIPMFERIVKESNELTDLLVEAETRGYDALADALVNIDNHKIHGRSDPKMAKVISDNIKWLLSKRRVKEYGDRLDVNINLTADKAIVEALAKGRARASQLALGAPEEDDVIDAAFTVIEQSDDEIMAEILR